MVSPRGTVELARKYAEQLTDGVDKALAGPLKPVRGPLKTVFEVFPIPFAPPPSREELQSRLEGKISAASRRTQEFLKISEVDWRRHARELLKAMDRGDHIPTEYPYPLYDAPKRTAGGTGGSAAIDHDQLPQPLCGFIAASSRMQNSYQLQFRVEIPVQGCNFRSTLVHPTTRRSRKAPGAEQRESPRRGRFPATA